MCAKRLVIDPVSRIEGHLRVDLELDGGRVQQALSSGTSFRGFEPILVGRDPRDAPQITQRICGVCPVPHATASCLALEEAWGVEVNVQARAIRNLIGGANFLDSHLIHFFVMTLPDFVSGMPTAGGWPQGVSPAAFRGGGSLDVQRMANHVREALGVRRRCHSLAAILGGKLPHTVGVLPGGAGRQVTAEDITGIREILVEAQAFINDAYAREVEDLAAAFPEYETIGEAGVDFMSFGAFPGADGERFFPRGVYRRSTSGVEPLDPSAITESVASSRFAQEPPAHPSQGTTEPELSKDDAYTWVKAPRLEGVPCEVGPLAREWVKSGGGGATGVMARHLARHREASALVEAMLGWVEDLAPGADACPVFPNGQDDGEGVGLTEAPRGALGHWVQTQAGSIVRYAVISPTTWNGSPRDENGVPGPMEAAMEGTPVASQEDPIEVMRVVQSFHPCVQCAVH